MGASDFYSTASGKTAKDAFAAAVAQAQWDHGHSGYSGSIAEKHDFVMINLPEDEDAQDYAEKLVNEGDPRIDDKWGPAGCIAMQNGVYLFFGWASS